MHNQLRIQLLGTPQVLVGDSPHHDLPAEKARLLFFYLLLFRKTPHPRSVLSGLFWGEHPEARARHSLNTALWRLRQWLEPLQPSATPFLLIEDGQIAFNTACTYSLDVSEFEERINWGRQMHDVTPQQTAAALAQAVELYQGDLMEGCYSDWCLAERDRLHQLFLQALVHLMVYHGTNREFSRAIYYGERILNDDPIREDVHRELMRLLMLDGRPAEALLQYRRCEAALKEELGIEPMPETCELFRKLMLGSNAVMPRPAATVRVDSSPTLATICQRLQSELTQFETVQNELKLAVEALSRVESDPENQKRQKRF